MAFSIHEIDDLSGYKRSYLNLDAPGGSGASCMFYAATLAFLLPVICLDDKFYERSKCIFGDPISQNEIQKLRDALLKYNGDIKTLDLNLFNPFVERFRKRVIDVLEKDESFKQFLSEEEQPRYFKKMRTSSGLGGEPELMGLSKLLGQCVRVFEQDKNFKLLAEHGRGDFEETMLLIHQGGSRDGHYRFFLLPEVLEHSNIASQPPSPRLR